MSTLSSIRRFLERSYAADYVGLLAVFLAYVWIQLFVEPFHQMFSLDDLRIQHPFAEHERVPVGMMFVYGGAVPLAALVLYFIVTRPGWHTTHVTILGLFISLILTSFITDVVKNAVGRPRPDLISRCTPKEVPDSHALFTIEVCTQSNIARLDEGFRSFPSGHSSFSFSGLGYLALFLAGQLHVFRPQADLGRALVALAPFLGALMIALSRLEDYRHDVYDVTVGSLLGIILAYITYRRYYPALRSTMCSTAYCVSNGNSDQNKARDEEEYVGFRPQSYERLPLQDRQ